MHSVSKIYQMGEVQVHALRSIENLISTPVSASAVFCPQPVFLCLVSPLLFAQASASDIQAAAAAGRPKKDHNLSGSESDKHGGAKYPIHASAFNDEAPSSGLSDSNPNGILG
ncbi:MAG: hypothetical protein ACRD72_06745 [Candidatus Angelobacter sp.]|jgi:hypothetical protein